MIQRIQTVYFLAIVVLMSLAFFMPTANLFDAENAFLYKLNYQGFVAEIAGETIILNSSNTWSLKIISAIIPIFALKIIFLYKKRSLQIRLSIANTVLMLGYYAVFFLTVTQGARSMNADWSLNIPSAFPLVCVILNWLAIRAIGKDIALLKSLSRLR